MGGGEYIGYREGAEEWPLETVVIRAGFLGWGFSWALKGGEDSERGPSGGGEGFVKDAELEKGKAFTE